jgi:hypothetical protein
LQGWYEVDYSPSISVDPCSLPLWECGLSACKPSDTHTGYHGEGDCSTFSAAQAFFILAALYAVGYLLFISGVLRGESSKWISGNFSGCCTLSSEMRPPCKPERNGSPLVPNGMLLCGVPFFMMMGLICILAQDKSEFTGMPQSYDFLFWLTVVLTVLGCAICAFNGRAQLILAGGAQAVVSRALPPRPLPRRQPLPQRPVGPAGAGYAAG